MSQVSSLPEHVTLDSDFSNLLGFARHPHPSSEKRSPPHLPVGPTTVYEVVALGCQDAAAGPRPALSPQLFPPLSKTGLCFGSRSASPSGVAPICGKLIEVFPVSPGSVDS